MIALSHQPYSETGSNWRTFFQHICLVLSVVLLFSLTNSPAYAQSSLREGYDYQVIPPKHPLDPDNDAVEVIEFFSYLCPHCASLEPILSQWLSELPEQYRKGFKHVPVIFRPQWEPAAREYYTLEALGYKDTTVHASVFKAIHKDKLNFTKEAAILQWANAHPAIDGEAFGEVFNSFSVLSKTRRSADLQREYDVTGVPSFVVAGRYRVPGPDFRGRQRRILEIIETLLGQEYAKRGS